MHGFESEFALHLMNEGKIANGNRLLFHSACDGFNFRVRHLAGLLHKSVKQNKHPPGMGKT
jgi:hypothetical protein